MDQIEVIIPHLNAKEVKYTFEVLLHNILGIDNFHFTYIDKVGDFIIALPNKNTISIENRFFSKRDYSDYNTSDQPNELHSYMGRDSELLFFYGSSQLAKIDKEIKLGFDIIGSSFYMLSRWEEYQSTELDEHKRFKGSASFAVKHHFINRPIVNEYADFLLTLFSELEYNLEDKRSYQIIATHDIDSIYKFPTIKSKWKAAASNMLKSRSSIGLKNILTEQKDPYDTFKYMLEVEKKHTTTAYYNVHLRSTGKWNGNYDIKEGYVRPLLEEIKNEGHEIGFHPSYDSYNNKAIFEEQLQSAKEVLDMDFKHGRQHFLNFEVPNTWTIWNDAGFEWESSLYYPEHPGFRCGICSTFNVFDIKTRSKLALKERPMSFMDVSYTKYLQLSEKACVENIRELKSTIKKYKGEFVFLWHNSFFADSSWDQAEMVFESLYE